MAKHLWLIVPLLLILSLSTSLAAQTVQSSNLLNQIEGYARITTGGLGGQLYVVTSKADYTFGEAPIPGSLRYGVEELGNSKRWIVFEPSLFTSTLSDGRKGAFITLKHPLFIRNNNLTIDGRAGSFNGAGRVVILKRVYDWSNYTVVNGEWCQVKRDAQGKPLEPQGNIITIVGAKNIIISHMIFRQTRLGSPPQAGIDEDCFGDQIGIHNDYPNGDPSQLLSSESYDKIWINRVQFQDCGDECVGITHPSPARTARISITRSEFNASYRCIVAGVPATHFSTRSQDGTTWKIRLTVAKSHFHNSRIRMPKINSSYVHLYNNFYQNWEGSGLDAVEDTRAFVEQNFFSTYLTGSVAERSILIDYQYNEKIWVDRNVYYKNATNQDYYYDPIPRYPEKDYYDSAAAPDILNIYSMNPVSAYTLLDQLGEWVAEPNDVYP